MKTFILILAFCFITTLVFADTIGEIVSIDIDSNGNIRVWTQYKIDGTEVESQYPKIDGKSVFCTRYSALNFVDMSNTEIKERILEDIDTHTKTLITKKCLKKANKKIKFKDVVGSKVSNNKAKVKINDKEYLLDTDGDITPVE